MKPRIIIITGPCGVGKSTITKLLANELNLPLVSGDQIKEDLFPDIAIITQHPEKLQHIKQEIFEQCRQFFENGRSAVVDYVITGENYIRQFQYAFGKGLSMYVLLPPKEVIYQRDESRECWTSGKEVIDHLYQGYVGLKEVIGPDNYINNEGETAFETLQKIMHRLGQTF